MDAQKIEEKVEALLSAERVLSRAGLCWGDRYEELKAPIRKARSELSEVLQTLASKEAELVRLREVLKIAEQAVREMSHAYRDPNWFTDGKAGAAKQFYHWKNKAQEAFAAPTQPPKEPT